jgi:hypothetical protein
MLPPKLVGGFWLERFHVAPVFITTAPVKVLSPVPDVAVVNVPLAPLPTVVTPDTVKVKPPRVRVPVLLILSVVQAALARPIVTLNPPPILTMSPATGVPAPLQVASKDQSPLATAVYGDWAKIGVVSVIILTKTQPSIFFIK